MNTPAETTGERRLIAAIRARVPADPGWLAVGIGDDAAVAAPERGTLEVFTADSVIEGVHFDPRASTRADVGWKALAVNLSDIAAMGATPRLALLSLALPSRHATADLDGFLDGFLALASEARVVLAGGNLARTTGPLVADVTVVGFVRPRRLLRRGGARPGEGLYVSGTLGAATAGLMWWRHAQETAEPRDGIDPCLARHRRPVPRLRLGALLGRNKAATACIDLSDGLADGVRQICEASGVGASIDAEALPIEPAARLWFEHCGLDPVQAALSGGDDYELLFTAPPRNRGRLATVIRQGRAVQVTRIGEVTRERDIVLRTQGKDQPLPMGFSHFEED